jgi:hypothetical protein
MSARRQTMMGPLLTVFPPIEWVSKEGKRERRKGKERFHRIYALKIILR